MPSKIILFNKPYNVLTQFTSDANERTLADYISIKDIYAAGRLDKDSEGLVLLTNDGKLQHQLTTPKYKCEKIYWAQVEGIPAPKVLAQLQSGVILKDGLTQPAKARIIEAPNIWPRNPPIRQRQHIPTTWLEIKISEGRNRQVRRMTAAVGFPTLRLVRCAIGKWRLNRLLPGEWQEISQS